MSSAYGNQPISDQVTAVNAGTVSSEALVVATRGEIERREPEIAAWVALSDTYVEAARAQDRAGTALPLRGISLGVKDLIDVAGLPTRAGSSTTSANPADADADCVRRFRELGAIVQGKTVTTEFGYFAPGPTRNPHGADHTPGGSSSGSAAAVGAGTIPIALGTQTAGSLTRPASFCGAAGMVLAQGSTSLAGITGLSPSLDSLGILTRTTPDLLRTYSAFTGVSPTPAAATRKAMVWHGSDLDALSPEMSTLVLELPDLLGEIGVDTLPLQWDDHVQTLADDHATVMSHEAADTLSDTYESSFAQLSTPLRELVETGRTVRADDHGAALIRRDRSRDQLTEILGRDAIIIGPAALGPAPEGLSATGSPVLSRPWQLLGAPVVVVPGAQTSAGLPLGVQLIGLPGQEPLLFDVATRLEPILRSMPGISA